VLWQLASIFHSGDPFLRYKVEAETTDVLVFWIKQAADFSPLTNPLAILCAAYIFEI
jgi:hypothetical protein